MSLKHQRLQDEIFTVVGKVNNKLIDHESIKEDSIEVNLFILCV